MVSRCHRHRNEGRFFGRRVNCEQVPLLPARVVAWMLDDTRKIPYLLIWKSHSDGTVKEAARIAPYYEAAGRGGPDWTGAFEIKRHDGSRDFIRTLLRTLPRNRGRVRLLICPTAASRVEGCTDGSQVDGLPTASCVQPGDAVNAICCATLQRAGRS